MATSAMEARYKTLKLVDLKAIAKKRGIKRVTNRRKADLIAEMVALDARETEDVAAAERALRTGKITEKSTGSETAEAENAALTDGEAVKPVRRRGRPRKKRVEDQLSADTTAVAESAGSEEQKRESGNPENSQPSPEIGRAKRRTPARRAENQLSEDQSREEIGKTQRRPKRHMDLGVEEESADAAGHGGYSGFYRRYNEQGLDRPRRHEQEQTFDRPRRHEQDSADSRRSYDSRDESRGDRQETYHESPRRSYSEYGHSFRPHREEVGDAVSPQLAEQMSDASEADGILEIMPDGYGFLHTDNFLTGEDDAYVAPSQIRRFAMKTGDRVEGLKKRNNPTDKFAALLRINSINGRNPEELRGRQSFENLTPIFPRERLRLERKGSSVASRVIDLIAPIGKGQRGLIVSPPKAGKTTLLKEVAKSVQENHPEMHMMILLIDERPEEVTDMKETIVGDNVEIIYSTFDQMPDHHTKVSEMVIERAKRLVEQGEDVIILLDSITRLARAYNLTVTSSGRILSGGLDTAALYMPKRFFGAARNMREGGSLTVLATALVDTGSRMDDVVYEEFKGTGNMELILDRRLSERRIFPAVDIVASGTRREDLLLDADEMEAARIMHRGINGRRAEENTEDLLNMFAHTKDNKDFIRQLLRHPIF
nr:transcription termination factor Rho [uncultured Shuttleworthia sp.]